MKLRLEAAEELGEAASSSASASARVIARLRIRRDNSCSRSGTRRQDDVVSTERSDERVASTEAQRAVRAGSAADAQIDGRRGDGAGDRHARQVGLSGHLKAPVVIRAPAVAKAAGSKRSQCRALRRAAEPHLEPQLADEVLQR